MTPEHRVLEDDSGGIKAVTVLECPDCKALMGDPEGHRIWHAELIKVFNALAEREWL